jgi:hypothetical protein
MIEYTHRTQIFNFIGIYRSQVKIIEGKYFLSGTQVRLRNHQIHGTKVFGTLLSLSRYL